MGSETVDPATGNPSFALPLQLPPGRGFTLPFSIRYSGTGALYVTTTGNGPGAYWTTPTLNNTFSAFDTNGWSYGLPNYQTQATARNASSNGQTNYCWTVTGYTFRGLDSTLMPLSLYLNFPDGNNQNNNATTCSQSTFPNTSYGPRNLRVVQTASSAGRLAPAPPSTITDNTGTVFNFLGGGIGLGNPTVVQNGLTTFGELANTITDRNGNQYTLTGQALYGARTTLNAGSYGDTAGRPALTWTGMGSTSGDQIGIYGLPKNFVVKWTTTNLSLPTHVASQSGSQTCALGGAASSVSVVKEIDLPNGTSSYSFTYGGAYGLLTRITFPDGGYIRYVWGASPAARSYIANWTTGNCTIVFDAPAISDRYVSYDGTTETLHQQFTYSTTTPTTSYALGAGTTITHNYELVASSWVLTGITNYQYNGYTASSTTVQDSSGNTLRTTNKTWADQYRPLGEQTILNTGQGKTTLYCPDQWGNTTDTYEYDFQSAGPKAKDPTCTGYSLSAGLSTAAIGPLLRHRQTVFHPSSIVGSSVYPDSITTFDGSGNRVQQQTFTYADTVFPSGATLGLTTAPASRLNPVTISQWLNTTGTYLSNTYTYFDTGQLRTATDPCGNTTCNDMSGSVHTTTYSYADNWATGSSNQSSSYLTKITDAASHTKTYTYNYGSGTLASEQDNNNQITSYAYNDPFVRLTDVYAPASSQNNGKIPHTNYQYVDGLGATETITGPTGITTVQTKNGFGHVTRSKLTSVSNGLTTDTTYDGAGNVQSVSNPYASTSDASYGLTSTTYDALTRPLMQCQPDNSSAPTTICQAGKSYLSWSYNGNQVSFKDELGNTWIRTSDALGRLASVTEPSGAQTLYSYDLLDNLTSVAQQGLSGETPRSRSFAYDSLSRLITATNPENGTTCYGQISSSKCVNGYDANGNLQFKTDATGVPISYTYDVLNRMTWKTASDGTNTNTYFLYDTGTNGVGRLSEAGHANYTNTPLVNGAVYGAGGTRFTYDEAGRTTGTTRFSFVTDSWQPGFGTVYDLAGNTTQLTYPDGRVLREAIDGAGRLGSITDTTSGTTYVGGPGGSIQYWASGSPMTVILGNGVTVGTSINNRLQPCHLTAAGSTTQAGSILDRELFHNPSANALCGNEGPNNGEVNALVDNLQVGWTQSFGYDNLSRLRTAARSDGVYNHTYLYDSFGNMRLQDNLHTSPNYTVDPSTNRLLLNTTDYQYDAAGRLTTVPGHTELYTAQGLLRSIDNYQTGSYVYNGLDERVDSIHNNTTTTEYAYFGGVPLAEWTSDGTWTDYIYANGKIAARVVSQKPIYDMHGVRDSSINMACGAEGPVSGAGGVGYTIQKGDHLFMLFKQTQPSYGGLLLVATSGAAIVPTDSVSGEGFYGLDFSDGLWHAMNGDLSSFAGLTISYTQTGFHNKMPAGTFDIYFADVAIHAASGAVIPVLTGQAATLNPYSTCGEHNQTAQTTLIATTDPVSTDYYLADQLGTTQFELGSSGWPLWQGQFTPFGQELVNGTTQMSLGQEPADGTALNYKFTGKERDTESGLDYFGARYYGSNMGRFVSPDEGTGVYADQGNPQSWNLYGYVQNNPLTNVDPDGHDCVTNNGDGTATINSGDCSGKDPNNEYYYKCDGCLMGTTSANMTSTGGLALYNANSNTISTISGYDYAGGSTGGFNPGSLAAGVFGSQSAGLWNSAAGTVNAAGNAEMAIVTALMPELLAGSLPEATLGIGGVGTVTAVGSRRNPVDVPRGTNEGTVIYGRRYSGHAIDEMQSSGVVPSMVEETIKNGTSSPGNTAGTIKYELDGLRVVTNSNGGVVTVTPIRR